MSNIINNKYLNVSNDMTHCIVYKKVGLCISFEVYEESTNEFLMACVACPKMSPMIIFLKLQNCHLRSFEDICCNLNMKYFLGRMMPDWMTGYIYTLTGFNGEMLCEIRIKAQLLTSAPIAFTAKITNLDYEADDIASYSKEGKLDSQGTRNRSQSFLGDMLLSCLPTVDASCFDERSNQYSHPGKSSTTTTTTKSSTSSYTTLSENNSNLQFTFISTKKPIWNAEVNQWMNFFGGRVKIPSVHNFLAVEVPPIAESTKIHYYQSAIQDQGLEKVCLRHGKAGHNAFILDFRSPVSPLIAFAIMCAGHCH